MDQDFRRMIVILLFGLAGICMAAITFVLYTNGIIVDEAVTGTITIQNIMAFQIIVWLIVGGIVSARG